MDRLKKADLLFEKGLFEEAIKEYEPIYRSSNEEEIKWKAFFRLCESLSHLYKYGEASNLLLSVALPDDRKLRAMVLLLKAETLQNFLIQYSPIQRKEVTVEGKKDIYLLSRGEVKEMIRESYLELWNLRSELVSIETGSEEYFLDLKEADLELYPTMFDVLVYSWTDYLFKYEIDWKVDEKEKLSAEMVVVEDFSNKVSLQGPPLMLSIWLMEEASRFKKDKRQSAAETWKVLRLITPFEKEQYFRIVDKKKLSEKAVTILSRWFSNFHTRKGKSMAGYKAAVLENSLEDYVEAVKLCKQVEKTGGKSYFAYQARILREKIQEKFIDIYLESVLPEQKSKFQIVTRNLNKVNFILYSIQPSDLITWMEKFSPSYSFRGWSSLLRAPKLEFIKENLRRKPAYKWQQEIEDKGDYKFVVTEVSVPPLEKGIYLVIASPDSHPSPGNDLIKGVFLNVTDLIMVGTGGVTKKAVEAYAKYIEDKNNSEIEDNLLRFYVVDARNGKPVPGAKIETFVKHQESYQGDTVRQVTDESGEAFIPQKIDISPPDIDTPYYYGKYGNRFYFDPIAEKNGAYAYWERGQNVQYASAQPVRVFIETDKPIYRPGHTVKLKAVAIWVGTSSVKALAKVPILLKAYDPNGKEFFSDSHLTGEIGTAAFEFKIPEGRLLGEYLIKAECYHKGFTGKETVSVEVEEYKPPEFEILLEEAKEPFKYNKKAKISGTVKYYFGGAVPGATVKYTIRRESFIPWFYRSWLRGGEQEQEDVISSGEIKSSEEGKFEIEFMVIPPPEDPFRKNIPDISRFIVEVETHDSGGRTVESRKTYMAGKASLYFTIQPWKGFFIEGEEIKIDSTLLTINDTAVAGESRYEVYSLADGPAAQPHKIKKENASRSILDYYDRLPDEFRESLPWDEDRWQEQPSLDVQLKDVKNKDLITSGSIKHGEDGKGIIKIVSLKAGVYRLVEKTVDPWSEEVSQEKIFIVADKNKCVSVKANSVTIAEKSEYLPGEKARFLIGSDFSSGNYRVEIWAGNYFYKSEIFEVKGDNKVTVYEVPIEPEMRGGITVRWFGVKDMKILFGQETVAVPWEEKELFISLEHFSDRLTPGEKVSWEVKLEDNGKNPVQGEILALMYDRSLEYYVSSENPWIDVIYRQKQGPQAGFLSIFTPDVVIYPLKESLIGKIKQVIGPPPNPPRAPTIRTWRSWVKGRGEGILFVSESETARGIVRLESPAAKAPESRLKMAQEKGGSGKKVEVRKALEDTSFFYPAIITGIDGKADISFVAPEKLTSWNVKMFALTRDAKAGKLAREVITKKDFMVRIDIPRFFREKDRGTINGVVHNESDKKVSGEVFVEIIENGRQVGQKLGLSESKRKFTLESHSLESFDFMLEIPQGVTTYKIKVSAVAGEFSDAEERELVILPSRQRIVESKIVSLSGNETKKIEILKDSDPTRISESVVMQIDPLNVLLLINTIPLLVDYPYPCIDGMVDKFVPLAILSKVYQKYPEIRKAVKLIPKRETIVPPWDKNDPRRLTSLIETPWVAVSEGIKTDFPLINLFDPDVVESKKQAEIENLRASQFQDGSFPWVPGGDSDTFVTLYILSRFAEALAYGVEIPDDITVKALNFAAKKLPSLIKDDDPHSLSVALYAGYVLTSFSPQRFNAVKEVYDELKSKMGFIEKHVYALTPIGKVFLAYIYHRMGNLKRRDELIDMATNGAKEDPVTGVYWTPEKYSWVWYSDTIFKHSFFLKTLMELRPNDNKIPGIARWLLFNRKGNVWKSPKDSTEAILSLLRYFERTGGIKEDSVFEINWGRMSEKKVVAHDEWITEPLRWIEKDGISVEDFLSATVKKSGKMPAFAGITWIYSTDKLPESSSGDMISLERKFYRRIKEKDGWHLYPVAEGNVVHVGDEVVVQHKINSRSSFEYIHLKSPLPAGFESDTLLSEWKWAPLPYYEEPRDSLTNYFIQKLPHGEFIITSKLRPTKPGIYRVGPAVVQSVYSPDLTAQSSGLIIRVDK